MSRLCSKPMYTWTPQSGGNSPTLMMFSIKVYYFIASPNCVPMCLHFTSYLLQKDVPKVACASWSENNRDGQDSNIMQAHRHDIDALTQRN